MIKPNTKSLPTSFEQGLRRVCEERKFGFLIAQRTFLGLGQNISCKIVDIPRACYTSTVSFIISRGSPYKRLFTRLWVLYNYVPIWKKYPFKFRRKTVAVMKIIFEFGTQNPLRKQLLWLTKQISFKARNLSNNPTEQNKKLGKSVQYLCKKQNVDRIKASSLLSLLFNISKKLKQHREKVFGYTWMKCLLIRAGWYILMFIDSADPGDRAV